MTGHQQNPTTGYNIKGDPALAVNLEALCRDCHADEHLGGNTRYKVNEDGSVEIR